MCIDALAYLTSETFDELVRSMKLYGASLRKGELPDEISRTTDKLTDKFSVDCDLFSSKKKSSQEQLNLCVSDFNKYVEFTAVDKE